ncbi:MAG: transglutaminase domain-containing protein, partial [Clostridia bacterium]|nr:transglutaminase domain-containing protein [Clostridia bacterium]
MKKIVGFSFERISGFLAAVTVLFCLCLPVSAIYTISPASETIPAYRNVYEAIYEAIYEQQSYLDVSRWKIRDYEIMTIFTDVMHNSPEFFFADQKLVYRYNQKGLVTSLSFSYHMSRTKRQECTEFYEQEISYIVHEVEKMQLTDPEAALYVHDYLISSYSYDTSETIYDVYGFLRERKGVCHAYSLCYIAVMRELGIPCYMVVSEDMNHSWNLIELDGIWYHVDLVYDDPQPDRPGQVLHNHFLLSDDGIQMDHGQGTHWGWSSMVVCPDTSYDQSYWKNSDTRMLYLNDMWYYVDDQNKTLCRNYFSGQGMQITYRFSE